MSAAAVGLGVYQVWSGIHNAEMIGRNADLTAQLAEENAKYADIDAWNAEKFGYEEQARYQTQVDQTVGEQRVGMAASDVDVSFGTAKQVQNETKLTGFLNMMDIQNQAHQKSLGIQRQAQNIRMGSQMAQGQASMDARAAMLNGFASAAKTGLEHGYSVGGSNKPNSDPWSGSGQGSGPLLSYKNKP